MLCSWEILSTLEGTAHINFCFFALLPYLNVLDWEALILFMLKNHKGHFGIIVCTFWMLQFDRGICNCDWILLCVVGQSQRGEDGWWCRGKEFGIRKTTGPSTGKHYWRNLDAFTLYSTIRSLMPNKTGNLCCFFLSSFRMLPFPSFSKIGIGYRGNYFVHALPIDTGNLGLTICYSPTQVNH